MCESHDGFIWTKGDDSQAPGCGTCWCCQPNGNQKLFNKFKIICNSYYYYPSFPSMAKLFLYGLILF